MIIGASIVIAIMLYGIIVKLRDIEIAIIDYTTKDTNESSND